MASADVIDMFIQLDLAHVRGDVSKAGVDGSQIDTWENNLLAGTSIRYGGYGGIAYRHISDTYIALFSHFIPCGVWEAVYLFEGLLKNESEVTVDIVHGDTQGQSLPVFGLAHMLGIQLGPNGALPAGGAPFCFLRPPIPAAITVPTTADPRAAAAPV
ncbi:hypothetical protein AMK16_30005 [Streptomyces sp. CB00455]|nr:hypothetical protein AMK16_30005 [Streptomyces sp. CB00455]